MKCPYCPGLSFTDVTNQLQHPRRPELEATVRCNDCLGHSVRYRSGKYYPLTDRTDINADQVDRVIDGYL